jgi:hypothetical protein
MYAVFILQYRVIVIVFWTTFSRNRRRSRRNVNEGVHQCE